MDQPDTQIRRKHETVSGVLGYVSMLGLGSSIGSMALYNRGETWSLFITFATILGIPFFMSGVKSKNISANMFFNDILWGISGVLVTGFAFMVGSYVSMAIMASISACVILIAKA